MGHTLPSAPVDNDGQWVARNKFKREKSFGFFKCHKCNKTWLSAHAFRKYRQGCKGCETKVLPIYLWENHEKNTEIKKKKDNKKPHDAGRCEACRKGVCKSVSLDESLSQHFLNLSI